MSSSDSIPGFTGDVVRPGDARYDELRQSSTGWSTAARADRTLHVDAGRGRRREPRARARPRRVGVRRRPQRHRVRCQRRRAGRRPPGCTARAVDPASEPHGRRGSHVGRVDDATPAHGLAVTGGRVTDTGVGGLTLGGGQRMARAEVRAHVRQPHRCRGRDRRRRGRRRARDRNPDLFWGLRGGGGNFGVVTEFEFALHESARSSSAA